MRQYIVIMLYYVLYEFIALSFLENSVHEEKYMKSNLLYRIFAGIVLLSFFSIRPASADVLNFGSGPYPLIPVVEIKNISPPSPYPPLLASGQVGAFFMTNETTGNTFAAWCIDPFHSLQASGNYALVPALLVFNAARVNALGKFATNHLASVTDSTSAGAFQLALWEIAFEQIGPLNVSQGSFTADAGEDANTLANTWLTAASNPLPNSLTVNIWASTDRPQHQWVVTFVPEAQSYAMMLVGLTVIAFVIRRRSKVMHAAV